MGKIINVESFDEMARTAKKLQQLSSVYEAIAKRLLATANNMGDAWAGEDNLAFVNQINGFAQELKFMSDKLEDAGMALDQQRANYVKRQDENINDARKLPN